MKVLSKGKHFEDIYLKKSNKHNPMRKTLFRINYLQQITNKNIVKCLQFSTRQNLQKDLEFQRIKIISKLPAGIVTLFSYFILLSSFIVGLDTKITYFSIYYVNLRDVKIIHLQQKYNNIQITDLRIKTQ